MSETSIITSVKEVTFDSVIAEFDKPAVTEPRKSFTAELESNPILDSPIKPEEKKVDEIKVEDKPVVDVKVEEKKPVVDKSPGKVEIKDIDSVLDRPDEEEEEIKEAKKGEMGLLSALEDLTKDEIIFPFEEDKPISEYSADDIKELLKANIEHQKKEALNTEINEFFESLPQEIQYAAKYVADGGTDLKGLFKALAATEEIKSLDTKQLKDRESIIREYYRAIDWGTEDEIQEEVDRVKELGDTEMEKLSNKYKPKLEKMHDQVTQQQLARQEGARKLQEQEMNGYLENANDAILAGKLGEIALDKKTQASLWAGLTQPGYQTRRGAQTNELGHLLEKYQYTEPNFELVYKALWLLRDEKGFFEAISKQLKNEVVSQTVRVLKTEQGKKTATGAPEEGTPGAKKTQKVIKRTNPGFLSGMKP